MIDAATIRGFVEATARRNRAEGRRLALPPSWQRLRALSKRARSRMVGERLCRAGHVPPRSSSTAP